jgi:hypothetical protein
VAKFKGIELVRFLGQPGPVGHVPRHDRCVVGESVDVKAIAALCRTSLALAAAVKVAANRTRRSNSSEICSILVQRFVI